MKRLLVANRGEIAVRVIRAARDLGIETVAVHSTADAGAAHVRMADSAIEIGKPPASKSYLVVDAILAAAADAGADAVHPGYGFLAERADFAQACGDAGLTFVGPDPDVIARMGDKAAARHAAVEAGVPTVPGSPGPVADADGAAAAADAVGYPVMLKAAAGGGGRGIRVVHDEAELRAQFPVASGEAGSAFGDARLYVERFVACARHVEVQVIGDRDRTVHLHERECSLQRRRQKVIEEARSPRLSEAARSAMTAAATRLAESVGYHNAGTVEFLVDDDTEDFFFIEMNTRIQVEHATTEAVCGLDLVTEQLRIASGEGLSFGQADVEPRGTAIELRVCAEDPDAGFMPSPGRAEHVWLPAGPWVRWDGRGPTPRPWPTRSRRTGVRRRRCAASCRCRAAVPLPDGAPGSTSRSAAGSTSPRCSGAARPTGSAAWAASMGAPCVKATG
ncbi:MAG: ATP-binding protein [Acidimicrobiia bacterium]